MMRAYQLFPLLLAVLSCQPDKQETPIKGSVHLLISESIAPAGLAQAGEFRRLYEKSGAHVTTEIVQSEWANSRFVLDTVRMILTTIPLNAKEKETVRRLAGSLVDITVAWDALVAVVHYRNPTDRITTTELRRIVTGEITNWRQVKQAAGMKGPINVYLQDSSDAAAQLKYRVGRGRLSPANWHRTRSSLATLQQLSSDPLGIGFVGLDWIDSAHVPAKALELASTEEQRDTLYVPKQEAAGKYFEPHPAHIYRSYYPLRRPIILYVKGTRSDVASGLATFMANKEGQFIFKQRGLVPGTAPIRLKR